MREVHKLYAKLKIDNQYSGIISVMEEFFS
jgi:hypothetical protein